MNGKKRLEKMKKKVINESRQAKEDAEEGKIQRRKNAN